MTCDAPAVRFSDLPPGLLRTRPDGQKRAPSSRLTACASEETTRAARLDVLRLP